jgi:hypothetical protein
MSITAIIQATSPTILIGPAPAGAFEGWGVRIG